MMLNKWMWYKIFYIQYSNVKIALKAINNILIA